LSDELSECESSDSASTEEDISNYKGKEVAKDDEDKDSEDGKVEGDEVGDEVDEVGEEDKVGKVSEGNKDKEIDVYVDSDDNEEFKAALEQLKLKYKVNV
jgi:hypothetical protein